MKPKVLRLSANVLGSGFEVHTILIHVLPDQGALEEVLPARSVLDACKYIAHGVRDDARLEAGRIAGQSVCFTRGCLFVGKDDGIIARHGGMNENVSPPHIFQSESGDSNRNFWNPWNPVNFFFVCNVPYINQFWMNKQ